MKQVFENLSPLQVDDSGTSNIIFGIKTGAILEYGLDIMSFSQIRNTYIVTNKEICGGKAIIQGTRITVSNIIELSHILEWSESEILDAYPHLTREQLAAAEHYYQMYPDEIDDILESEQNIDR